jgi:hypothetical protein
LEMECLDEDFGMSDTDGSSRSFNTTCDGLLCLYRDFVI